MRGVSGCRNTSRRQFPRHMREGNERGQGRLGFGPLVCIKTDGIYIAISFSHLPSSLLRRFKARSHKPAWLVLIRGLHVHDWKPFIFNIRAS